MNDYYDSIDDHPFLAERFYQNSNLSWIEKIQLIKLLKSDEKCNIVSTLDVLSCHVSHNKLNMPKNIINLSGYNSNHVLDTVMPPLGNTEKIPLNYKGDRINSDLN